MKDGKGRGKRRRGGLEDKGVKEPYIAKTWKNCLNQCYTGSISSIDSSVYTSCVDIYSKPLLRIDQTPSTRFRVILYIRSFADAKVPGIVSRLYICPSSYSPDLLRGLHNSITGNVRMPLEILNARLSII